MKNCARLWGTICARPHSLQVSTWMNLLGRKKHQGSSYMFFNSFHFTHFIPWKRWFYIPCSPNYIMNLSKAIHHTFKSYTSHLRSWHLFTHPILWEVRRGCLFCALRHAGIVLHIGWASVMISKQDLILDCGTESSIRCSESWKVLSFFQDFRMSPQFILLSLQHSKDLESRTESWLQAKWIAHAFGSFNFLMCFHQIQKHVLPSISQLNRPC